MQRLQSTWVNPRVVDAADAERVLGKAIEREYTLADLLRRPEVTYASLLTMTAAQPKEGEASVDDPLVAEQVEIQTKYQAISTVSKTKYRAAIIWTICVCPMRLITPAWWGYRKKCSRNSTRIAPKRSARRVAFPALPPPRLPCCWCI